MSSPESSHCDNCSCIFSSRETLRRRISYFAVNDPPIGTYEVEPPEETWEELIAAMAERSATDNEADVSERGTLLLCADCFRRWWGYIRPRPLTSEALVCAHCPGEFPVSGGDLWMVWFRASLGGEDGTWVAVSPGEVSRRYKLLDGEKVPDDPVEIIAEGLAKLELSCLCADCYRRWINDPADIPDD